jgi:hypothetical protein
MEKMGVKTKKYSSSSFLYEITAHVTVVFRQQYGTTVSNVGMITAKLRHFNIILF